MKITAIALSGGRSSRMGRDKALLEINGRTMLLRTCLTALQIAESIYIVVRSQEQYQKAISEITDCTFMVLDKKFGGALVGFWQGINAIAEAPDWILLLACDLPNIQSDIFQTWASRLADLPDSAIAYLPRYSDDHAIKQWEPLCGFYRWRCRDSLKAFIDNGGRSFQKWLINLEVAEISQVHPSLLFNCNTPEDFCLVNTSSES